MTGSSWNPPTGPPNDAPVSATEARQQIEGAIADARTRDGELRAGVAEAVRQRVLAAERLPIATEEAADARTLARRALEQSDEAARSGQRDDAARLSGAAQVFALRLRSARDEVARLERQQTAAAERIDAIERAMVENVGRLQAVAAARLPALRGRKAAKAQAAVDDAVAELRRPLDDVVAQATRAAEAEAAEADETGEAGDAAYVVADDDLESELDFDGAEDVLAELRADLGIGADASPAAEGDPGDGEDAATDAAAEPDAADADAGADTATADADADAAPAEADADTAVGGARAEAGPAASGRARTRSWPVPASHR